MKRKSQRGLKWQVVLMCLMILHDATMCHAIWDPPPPIVWRHSKLSLINGVELMRIDAEILSPCVLYDRLNTSSDSHVQRLKQWCERSFESNVMEKLAKMDQPTGLRVKRIPPLIAGALAALAAVPGLGWAAIAVAAVVIAGVAAYAVLSNRISGLQEQVTSLEAETEAMKANQQKQRVFAEQAQADIQSLATKHNLLSDSFMDMKRDFAELLTLTTDIASRLAVIGEMLEDGISLWLDGKVSGKLLRALNITVACGKRCPLRLMEPVSWNRENSRLSLVIVAPLIDRDRHLMSADPFILTEQEGTTICYSVYRGTNHVTLSRDMKQRCTLTHADNVYHDIMAAAHKIGGNDEQTHNPWQKQNCTVNGTLLPQIKRIAGTYIIYCNGMTITIDGSISQSCPSYPFTLSVKLSFLVGNYSYTGMDVVMHAQQEMVTMINERINREIMPGFNPNHVETRSGNVSLDWVEVKETGGLSLAAIMCIILLLVVIALITGFVWYTRRDPAPIGKPRIEIEVIEGRKGRKGQEN